MATDDARAAAERIRRQRAGEPLIDIYPNAYWRTSEVTAVERDIATLADAYLALILADDGDAIDHAFAHGIGLPPGMWALVGGRVCLTLPLVDGPPWDVRCFTRGDGRRLLTLIVPSTEAGRE